MTGRASCQYRDLTFGRYQAARNRRQQRSPVFDTEQDSLQWWLTRLIVGFEGQEKGFEMGHDWKMFNRVG